MIAPSYTATQKAQRYEASRRQWAREQATLRKVRGKKRCSRCTAILEKSCEVHCGMCVECRYVRMFGKTYISSDPIRDLHPLAHLERFNV